MMKIIIKHRKSDYERNKKKTINEVKIMDIFIIFYYLSL